RPDELGCPVLRRGGRRDAPPGGEDRMSERRRGLGRGLGALIPSEPQTQDRPRDVFFPRGASPTDGANGDGFTGNMSSDPASEPSEPTMRIPADEETDLAPVPGATFA